MSELLELISRKATYEVWQRPNQDRAARFSAKPITTNRGAKRFVTSGHNTAHLPDTSNAYIVYDLGQLNPNLYGFDTFMNEWSRLDVACNREEMFIQPLLNNRRLPMKYGYIMRTEFRSTLIAFRRDKCFGLFDRFDELHITFYSNMWYNTADGNLTTGLEVKTYDIDSNATLTAMFNELTAARGRASNEMVFVNGMYRNINAGSDLEIGDYVDLIEDMSGLGHYDIKLSEAPFFHSSQDVLSKYLLLAPDSADWEDVRFKDDINIVIYNNVNDSIGGQYEAGVVYDLHKDSDIRMVTHRDHSIDSVRTKNIVLMQDGDLSQANLYARVFFRNADVDKVLPDDGNYIRDMYLFAREDRKSFMVGTMAVLDEWEADNLEGSPYTKWLGYSKQELTIENMKEVFSSHGLYNIVEKPVKAGATYELPPIAFKGGMAILYDADFELHSVQAVTDVQGAAGTYPMPAGAEYMEFIPGEMVANGTEMESSSGLIDAQGEYAEEYFFRGSTNQWEPASEGIHYTLNYDDDTIVWDPAYAAAPKLKRDSGKFHMNTRTMNRGEVIEYFDIFIGTNPSLTFETGRVDIWLNGRKLIRGLDFQVEWPSVRIHNVEYLQDANDVMVLAHGLYKDRAEENFGFMKYSFLNYDERYKLSFNRPVDITIDGKLGVPEEIAFSERRTNTTNAAYREGAPYSILPPLYHIPIVTEAKLSKSRSEGIATTSKIEDYITGLEVETILPVTNVITNKHEVVSYVLSKLIEDLNNGDIRIINDNFSAAGVASIMAKYRLELEIDPGTKDDWEWEYVLLAAHNLGLSVGVSAEHYTFLEKVVEYYFDNRCQLNNYLHIV